jgi:predicted SAM-dependent methyltransferase
MSIADPVCEVSRVVDAVGVSADPLKVNIGAGGIDVPGFTPLDIKNGVDVRALPYPDNSLKAIRASHVLEHLGQNDLLPTVQHWFSKLMPGGTVSIAVPDFRKIIELMNNGGGANHPIESFIMGGQQDEHDYHRTLFDVSKLDSLLRRAGFDFIRRWRSEVVDCASLEPVTLNLRATKPPLSLDRAALAMSVPRLMFTDSVACCDALIARTGICPVKTGGAFWGQCMDRMLTVLRDKKDYDWIVTCDYDTIFQPGDVVALLEMAEQYNYDALCPLQVKRESAREMLASRKDAEGNPIETTSKELQGPILPISSGHFGLTVIRVSALVDLPKPWFISIPCEDGGYADDETKVDDDIYFWRNWVANGRTLGMAMDVPVGHMQRMVTWPTRDLGGHHQFISEWTKTWRKPDWAW